MLLLLEQAKDRKNLVSLAAGRFRQPPIIITFSRYFFQAIIL